VNWLEPGAGADRAVVRGDRVKQASNTEPAVTRPWVIKIGGRALEGAGEAELARELSGPRGRGVLVHGGGARVSEWCTRLGIEPRFHRGLRVTDAAALEVATAVLGGLANKQWVALLQAHGLEAAGLCALDAGLARVRPHPEAAQLGQVGEVTGVDVSLLLALLARGITPVLASIGSCDGELLNVNADDLAAAVAGALQAPALVLLSDTPGVKLGDRVVPALTASELDAAIEHEDVTGGMQPKLEAARRALETGARCAIIAAWNGAGTLAALLEGRGPGTVIGAPSGSGGAAAPALAGAPMQPAAGHRDPAGSGAPRLVSRDPAS